MMTALFLSLVVLMACESIPDPDPSLGPDGERYGERYIEATELLKEYEHDPRGFELKYADEDIRITGIVKGRRLTGNKNSRMPTPNIRIDGDHEPQLRTYWIFAGMRKEEVEHTYMDTRVYLRCKFRDGDIIKQGYIWKVIEIYVTRCNKISHKAEE